MRLALPVAIEDDLSVAEQLNALRSVVLLEQLAIGSQPIPNAIYSVALAHTVRFNSVLAKFLGGSLQDGAGIVSQQLVNFHPVAAVTDGVGVADLLANQLILHVTVNDKMELTHDDLVRMLFMPRLIDGIELGSVTTWVVNTRTGGVTEYSDFDFNSFAAMGNRFLGAKDDGLYVLDGTRDDGSNIIARIKSGLLQPGGSHPVQFKGIYVGMRVDEQGEDFFLKIETGAGKSTTYRMRPKNMATTKINVGKGLRTRYFSWELVSSGADFDLDSIEFIPLASDRRV